MHIRDRSSPCRTLRPGSPRQAAFQQTDSASYFADTYCRTVKTSQITVRVSPSADAVPLAVSMPVHTGGGHGLTQLGGGAQALRMDIRCTWWNVHRTIPLLLLLHRGRPQCRHRGVKVAMSQKPTTQMSQNLCLYGSDQHGLCYVRTLTCNESQGRMLPQQPQTTTCSRRMGTRSMAQTGLQCVLMLSDQPQSNTQCTRFSPVLA